jgi:16S rRNA (guanine527-N7)-methyltransferase
MVMPIINWLNRYFPEADKVTVERTLHAIELYRSWNSKVNVISRKDIDHIENHHFLFSLSVAKAFSFGAGTEIMDAGTGGGFPGIPLAIFFPEVKFTLVDSIAKKIRVVENIASELGLKNVETVNGRFESLHRKFDFITGRAVINLPAFYQMTKNLVKQQGNNASTNGIIYLSGGDIVFDPAGLNAQCRVYPVSGYFAEPFFETKKIVHIYSVNK